MKKILIIEDEDPVRAILTDLLSEKGYRTLEAADGKEGIQLAKSKLPDLIISDIMMPEVNGYSVKKELSMYEITSHIPFIFLTAKADMQDMRTGMELGADDYISKPFKAADLLKAIEVRIQKNEAFKDYLLYGERANGQKLRRYDISDYLFIDFHNKTQFIKIRDIVCITANNEYSEILTSCNQKFILRKTLTKWEDILPASNFVRIHRATIINIEYIEKMEKYSSRTIKVWLKNIRKEVIVSQRYTSKLRMQL